MEARASLVKRIEGIGKKVSDTVPKRIAMRFEDGRTGKMKAAAIVKVADTYPLRVKGLSKVASIGSLDGMFFDCKGPFWMKDVEFPLDICWLDRDGRVTEKTAMAKDKTGSTVYPAEKTASVSAIELPSGFCDRFGIGVGDRLVPVKGL